MADTSSIEWIMCERGGMGVGFQWNVMKEAGRDKDNIGTDAIKLICSVGNPNVVQEVSWEGDEEVQQTSLKGAVGQWLEPRRCMYRQALCGLQVQTAAYIADAGYDNTGLNNFKFLCCNVPNPAKICKPKEEKVLMGSCDNFDRVLPTECDIEVPIGVNYEYKGHEKSIHFHESIGYNLPCVKRDLKNTMRQAQCNKSCEFTWNSPLAEVYQSIAYSTIPLKAEGRTKIDIYQIQGSCGFYTVHTNKLIKEEQKLGSGGKNPDPIKSFVMAPLPSPAVEKCAIDTEQISGGDLPLIKMDKRLPPYEKPPSSQKYTHYDKDGVYITNPLVTNRGEWSEWQTAPKKSFVGGMNNNRRVVTTGTEKDFAGLTSIAFVYQTVSRNETDVVVTSHVPNVTPPDFKNMPAYFCEEGSVIGLQANSQPDQGPGDDVGMDNVKFLCSFGQPAYKSYEGPHYSEISGLRGMWTEPVYCKPKQVACGLRIQGETYIQKADLSKYDNTGINNIQVRCCPVDDPVSTCVPTETRALAAHCDNSHSEKPRKCKYIATIGVLPDYESSKRAVYFYHSLGFTTSCEVKKLFAKFSTLEHCPKGACLFPWDKMEQVFAPWRNIPNELEVGGNVKVELYQVVGQCGIYHVTTPRYIKKSTNFVTGEETEETFDAPVKLQDPGCWSDFADIDGTIAVVGLTPKRLHKIPYHNSSLSRPLRKESDGIVLQSPSNSNSGEYGTWQYCPNGSYVAFALWK